MLVKVLEISGRDALLASKCNPGHDITVDGLNISLKTQADRGVNLFWVSKFMELSRGLWKDNPTDLEGLRQQFFEHMENYDRILSLRTLEKGPRWKYELVEIPKALPSLARFGTLEMKTNSKQIPKLGYCCVSAADGCKLFDLYFDGGTERKLQLKNLRKDRYRVHAVWEFVILKRQ